jgi:hypothetical protein
VSAADALVGKLTARDGYHGIALDRPVAERAAIVVVDEIVAWLHEPEALWEIVKAYRDGCPEYAGDRLAEAVYARFAEELDASPSAPTQPSASTPSEQKQK